MKKRAVALQESHVFAALKHRSRCAFMIKGKKGMEWSTILGAIILVILIFVAFIFIFKIKLGGQSMSDIIDKIKKGDWKGVLGKSSSSPSSDTESGDIYICNDKFHEIIVGGNSVYAKMEKCVNGAAIIGLYSTNNEGALLDKITIKEGAQECASKAGVCIKLFSIDTSGKTPTATFSYKPISEAFEATTLSLKNNPPGAEKEFWCSDINLRVVLRKYQTVIQNHVFLDLYVLSGDNPGQLTGYSCTARGDSPSGWDSGAGMIRCVNGGTFECGGLKFTCGFFDKNAKQIQISHCSKMG